MQGKFVDPNIPAGFGPFGIQALNGNLYVTFAQQDAAKHDQRLMFPIFKLHAAAGAALMFTSGTSHGVAIGSYHDEPLYHASLAPEEYQALLEANGFRIGSQVSEDPNCGRHTIWIAQAVR
jgi:hypothetical protein